MQKDCKKIGSFFSAKRLKKKLGHFTAYFKALEKKKFTAYFKAFQKCCKKVVKSVVKKSGRCFVFFLAYFKA